MPSTLTRKSVAIDSSQDGFAGRAALSWCVHRLKQRPSAAVRPLFCLLFVFGIGLVLFHNALPAAIPCAALFFSLSEYFLPTHYDLTEHSAKSRCGFTVLEMPWVDVRHAYLADTGVKLSPLRGENSRFESMRGIFLHFAGNEQEVIDTVRRLREKAKAHE